MKGKASGAESDMEKKDLFKYHSVKRISKLPVVETSYQYVSGVYNKLKNSNRLMRWSLGSVESGFLLAVDKTMPTIFLLDTPLSLVDTIICKGLDTVEHSIPAITYPPHQIVDMSKDYVSTKLIEPVLKRADSVKQLGLSEATRVGEIAATRLDTALDIADKYVDKYLPDATDSTDGSPKKEGEGESKATHAINHMNRLSKKLQRRITKRTLMEAQALKKGSADIIECALYLADLLMRDPKEFLEQMKSVWSKLSEDEPENQVPPANLEQVVSLLVRESARRVVHTINFLISTLPSQTAHLARFSLHHLEQYINYALKVVHLEGAKGIAIATSRERLTQLQKLVLHIIEVIGSKLHDERKEAVTAGERQTPDSNANSPVDRIPQASNSPTSVNTKATQEKRSPTPFKNEDSVSTAQPVASPTYSNYSVDSSTSSLTSPASAAV